MLYSGSRASRVLALITIGALSLSGAILPVSLAGGVNSNSSTPLVGQLIAYGQVTINGRQALTGTSVFPNSQIRVACAVGSSAIIRLGQGGRMGTIELRPGAWLQLGFNQESIGGELREGSLRLRTPAGMKVGISTPEGRIETDGRTPALTPVSTKGEKSASCRLDQADQLASIENGVTTSLSGQGGQGGQGGQTVMRPSRVRPATTASTANSSLSPAALAALIFGVGVAGAITIVALTQSGYQVSPIAP